jgi:hypothetical protein
MWWRHYLSDPRHRPHCRPSLLELNGSTSRGEHHLSGPSHPPHCRPSFLEFSRSTRRGERYLPGPTTASAFVKRMASSDASFSQGLMASARHVI